MTANPPNAAARTRISIQARAFVLIAGILGFAELISLGLNWHSIDSRRFIIYLILTAATSLVHIKAADNSGGFSLNLPFILLSIIDLSTPEAVTIGCVAAAIQYVRSPEPWSFRRFGLSVGVQATVIASASFVFHSLQPEWLKNSSVRLFVAAVALFFANTFPAAILRRFTGVHRLGELWKKSYFWSLPFYLVAAALAQVARQGLPTVSSSSSFLALVALYLAYRHYRGQKAEWMIKARHADDMAALHLRAIEGLALAVEAKDNLNTRGHIRRVQVYALGIGRKIGLKGAELEALQAGSLLHDIGKLAVPEHILTKPGKLTAEEFAKMKVHPLVGAEIVEQMKFPYPVAPIVRAHHEKWDGSGYPFGLKGEDIPLGARILTVADWLDAMISDREYRKGIPLDQAMKQIVAESGRSFDPAVVEALRMQYQELRRIADKQAAEGPVLSTDVNLENKALPGAGLEMCGLPTGAHETDFLATINAAAREQQLLRATAEAAASLDPAETMRRIESTLRDKIPHDALAFFGPKGNVLRTEFAAGVDRENLLNLELPFGEGLMGWVAQNMQPVVNGNPAVDPGFVSSAAEPLQSVLALPLTCSQGLVAVLALYRVKKDSFTRAELALLTAVQGNIATAIKNAFAYREAESKAKLDDVTGLLTRTPFLHLFDSELRRAHRNQEHVALVVSELPPQCSIPAETSRQLWATLSRALREVSRADDHLGRIDEHRFALILPRVRAANMLAILERLREITQASTNTVLGHPSDIRLAGAFYPDDGDGARHLLSVVEQRLASSGERWEESLRALILASKEGSAVEAPQEAAVSRPTAP